MPEWTSELRRRLSSLAFSPEREPEIIEELSHHLDDRVRELVAGGTPPQEARRIAVSELSDHDLLAPHFARLRQAPAPEPLQATAPAAASAGSCAAGTRPAAPGRSPG